MNNGWRGKGATERRTCGDLRVSNESHDDELQSDQRAGRRPDNHVKVRPFGECCHYSAVTEAWYCSSLTFSIQSTVFPSSCSTIAMCVMAVVGVAPCQCFSPGGHEITSPGRISLIGPPQLCTSPQPAVTISVWPSRCVCHAVRAPGSNVTLTPSARAGSGAWNSGSIRTVPVKYSAGPLPEGCDPILLMSILELLHNPLPISQTIRSGTLVPDPVLPRRQVGR